MSRFTHLDIFSARKIENGRYWLFGMECPTEVMAAYERLERGYGVQENGDRLVAWVVEQTLAKGDFELAMQLRDALERLGWQAVD